MRPPKSILHLIVNPTAGRGAAARKLPAIESSLRQLGREFETTLTTARGHARQIAERAILIGDSTVVAVGGDGTLHEVSNAVIDADPSLNPTLGLIALGTGNDFARCVGLAGTVEEMCAILANGERRLVDVGTVESHDLPLRRFLVAAGVGYIADTAATVNKGIRFLHGMPAYLLGAVITLSKFHPTTLTLTFDNLPPRTVEAMLISVANVATTGGGMLLSPGALCDDGKLDVCLVKKISRLELLRQLPNVIKGTHVTHAAVEIMTATSVKIESKVPMALWIDGEVVGSTPATFSIEPGKLPMLLPAA